MRDDHLADDGMVLLVKPFAWWGETRFTLIPAAIGEFLQAFVESPPSQASGTFGVDQALAALQDGGLEN